MTEAERKDIDNGIWMCRTHATLIDNDERKFTIETLKSWRQISEKVAELMQETGSDYEVALTAVQSRHLTTNEIRINQSSDVVELIGDLLQFSYIRSAWAPEAFLAVRDFIIEHVQNAFQHGQADSASVSISPDSITIIDNGADFNVNLLFTEAPEPLSGGQIAFSELITRHSSRLAFATAREDETNITIIRKVQKFRDIQEITDCHVNIKHMPRLSKSYRTLIEEKCREIFVLLPDYLSPSHALRSQILPDEIQINSKPLIFVGSDLSETVWNLVKRRFPGNRYIKLPPG